MNTISTAAPNTLPADKAQPGMARVRAFYRNNHAQQTMAKYLPASLRLQVLRAVACLIL